MIDKRKARAVLVNRKLSLPDWWKGSVTDVSPLSVSVRGADPIYPDSLVSGLTVDDKVWGVTVAGRAVVLGRFGGANVADSGWQSLELLTGYTGTCRYRQAGGWVSLRFDITGAVGAVNTQLTDVLPGGYWPTTDGVTIYRAADWINPAAARASGLSWFAADSGAVWANSGGGADITRIRGHVSWVLG